MGVLQDQLCLPADALYPAVLRLEHIPKTAAEVDEMFGRANVVVTTMSIAGKASADVQERMAQMCGALFIDEAHHITARTWRAFRAWFTDAASGKLIFQFTATPFREDGGKVDGKFIYYYPLAKAQQEDYFGNISFQAVSDLEGDEADDEILRLVGEHSTAISRQAATIWRWLDVRPSLAQNACMSAMLRRSDGTIR
jgi:superfamily II DNA or RNA helicase